MSGRDLADIIREAQLRLQPRPRRPLRRLRWMQAAIGFSVLLISVYAVLRLMIEAAFP
jgi:hypothetical protein